MLHFRTSVVLKLCDFQPEALGSWLRHSGHSLQSRCTSSQLNLDRHEILISGSCGKQDEVYYTDSVSNDRAKYTFYLP